jgi:hypothetical protein
MARACGLESYTGPKLSPVFKINFGSTVIKECPNSYCKWEYVGDAMEAWSLHQAGYLPEVYDENAKKPLSILDQTEFFTVTSRLVESVKNKQEAKAYEAMQSKHKK